MDLLSMSGVPNDPVANEQRLRQGEKISYSVFQGVIGASFGFAILAFTARMAHRLKTRCRLSLEDYVLMFGVACLSSSAGVLFKCTRMVFLLEAAGARPVLYAFTTQEIMLLRNSGYVVAIGNILIWTVIYSVKFFFLALFNPLIKRGSTRITIYYWTVVALTALFWAMQTSFSLFFCHSVRLGDEFTSKCLSRMKVVQPWGLTNDIITDLMSKYLHPDVLISTKVFSVIFIPILILHKSRMESCKKLGLSVFLCLSVVMITIAIARSSGYFQRGAITKATWHYLWVYLEASIATIMASITAFSAFVLTKDYKAPDKKKGNQNPMLYSFRERLLRKKAWRNRLEWEERDGEHLPHVPSATLTGIYTFIHRQGRSTADATETMRSTPYYFWGRKESPASTPVSSV